MPVNNCRGNEGNRKLSLWDDCINCHWQDSPIDAKINGRKIEEKLGMRVVSVYLPPDIYLLQSRKQSIFSGEILQTPPKSSDQVRHHQ